MRGLHRPRRRPLRRRAAASRVLTNRARFLWLGTALFAVLAVVILWMVPRLQMGTGTLLVIAAGRSASVLPPSELSLRVDGSWSAVGTAGGDVPAAPEQRRLLEVAVPTGSYDAVRLGTQVLEAHVDIKAGQVEPLLLGIESGRVLPGAVYAGNDDVNLGLNELAGRFVPMPAFELTDQAGRPFNLDAIAGKDVVIAAFNTACRETCPLYTALMLQLDRHRQSSVMLVEVTTDPSTDTPAVLAAYAKRVGADWTFATGTEAQLAAFWKPFGVALTTGDTHVSTLALLDRHGYIRLVYRGAPRVGSDIPPALATTLSAQGLKQLASGGDGWGAPDVLQALATIARAQPSPEPAGGRAPEFELQATDGATVRLSDLAGKALVINFWAASCPPCKAEMPLLDRTVTGHPGVRLVLVNEGESAQTAEAFLSGIGVDRTSLLDSDLRVGRAYGVAALPTTVFVKADGTIDRRQIGQLDPRVLASELSNLSTQ